MALTAGLAGPALADGPGGGSGDGFRHYASAPGGRTVAGAPPGRGGISAFKANEPYTGDFPDPSVIRVGGSYVAYGTNTGSVNLPVLTSTDMVNWYARGIDAGRTDNDGLPVSPIWSQIYGTNAKTGQTYAETWAPSPVRIKRDYLVGVAVEAAGRGTKCIGIARGTNPLGPFSDPSGAPIVCPVGEGAIDPSFVQVGKGKKKTTYLLWKNEGSSTKPARLLIRKLNKVGTAFAKKSKQKVLVRPTLPWQGSIVENPAMIRYKDRYLLFYSGNRWDSANYATGYGVCKTPLGPCKLKKSPLLGVQGLIVGAGGADPVVDAQGRLRLVFHAWTAGEGTSYVSTTADCTKNTPTNCPQRKLHTAVLHVKKKKQPLKAKVSVVQLDGARTE